MTDKAKSTLKRKNWLIGLILPDEDFPLYQLERRKLKWARTPEKARDSLWFLFWLTIVIFFSVWVTITIIDVNVSGSLQRGEWSGGSITFMFGVSMTVLSGFLDFACMVVASGSIGNERILNRWDLLRLATDKEHIARSKHAFTRLQITRVLIFNLATRVVILFTALLFLFNQNMILGYGPNFIGLLDDFLWYLGEYPSEAITMSIFWVLLITFYLIEPLWRVRAVTAMGVALSARVSRVMLYFPLAFALLLGMWIAQTIVLYALTSGISWISSIINDFLYRTLSNYYSYSDNVWLFLLPLWIAIYYGVVWGFYRVLKGISYRRIKARIY